MPSNERSAQPQRAHFPVWARLAAGVVLVVSIVAAVFSAGFFTEREYPYLFASLEGSLEPEQDLCIQMSCVPAGRAGQHCRQYWAPC
jgi:hypothetical protein